MDKLETPIDYDKGMDLQHSALERIKSYDAPDCLILLRHNPVITKGNTAKTSNILASAEFLKKQGIDISGAGRGGDVTYHGPGQLIGYPVIDTRRKKLRDYKSKLCDTLICLLKDYGIEAEERYQKMSGIWIGEKKIAAIGYAFKKSYSGNQARIITQHGFALYAQNIGQENFKYIYPCGMPGLKITSIEELTNKKPDFNELKKRYINHFERIFKYGSRQA